MRCRAIPEISLVEQPPTYAEAFAVQRFQAALSAFTVSGTTWPPSRSSPGCCSTWCTSRRRVGEDEQMTDGRRPECPD